MPHPGVGDELQNPLHHHEPRPQDGHQGELFPGEHLDPGGGDGGLHRGLLQLQVPHGLVGHEHGDLFGELAEVLGARALVPEVGQLVLDQGVVHQGDPHRQEPTTPPFGEEVPEEGEGLGELFLQGLREALGLLGAEPVEVVEVSEGDVEGEALPDLLGVEAGHAEEGGPGGLLPQEV